MGNKIKNRIDNFYSDIENSYSSFDLDKLKDEIMGLSGDEFYGKVLYYGNLNNEPLNWAICNIYYNNVIDEENDWFNIFEVRKVIDENYDNILDIVFDKHMELNQEAFEAMSEEGEEYDPDEMDVIFDWKPIVNYIVYNNFNNSYGLDIEYEKEVFGEIDFDDEYNKWLKNYSRRKKLNLINIYGV